MPTEEQYYQSLHKLLPPGKIWPGSNEDTNLNTLIRSFAAAVKEPADDVEGQFNDVFPDSYVPGNFLSDWERVMELPKSYIETLFFLADVWKCGQALSITNTIPGDPLTDEERRDYILAFLQSSRFNNDQFYIDIAAVLNFTVTIATIAPAQWTITVTGGTGTNTQLLEATCRFFSPFHTQLTFIYPP
jgi:uncharacterized protein YmfQ (DUF2313 family)